MTYSATVLNIEYILSVFRLVQDLPLHEREKPTRPDFSQPWSQGDVIFSVEERPLFVNKSVCTLWSPVMEAMFNGDFLEKDAKQIALPGKKWDHMYALMEVIHPPNNKGLDCK